MFEISIEVGFHCEWFVSWLSVSGCEAFSEDVSALVMLVFESAFSQDLVNVLGFNDLSFVSIEIFPNGVVFGGSRVYTDDLTNE